MAHVTALAQHILTLEPDKDAARLCFYHFLKNLCEPAEPVDSELINRFFFRALAFHHWQENKLQLFHEVAGLLQHFQDSHRTRLEIREVCRPENLQVIAAENVMVLERAVCRFLERRLGKQDQFRLLPDTDRVIAIVLREDRGLTVTAIPRYLMIRDGELQPLTLEFTLHYTSDLTIHPQYIQQLEIGPHASARFHSTGDGYFGSIIRGYTFQRYATIDGGGLAKHPVLFYPLKRLEQFFVNRQSDQMYMELTSLLEKSMELISQGHPDALKFAEAALDRGRLALEHIYSDDKVIELLIKNLEKTLALEAARSPGSLPMRTVNDPLEHRLLSSPKVPTEGPPPGTYEIA